MIRAITMVVSPETWDAAGGPGVIDAVELGDVHVLAVSQAMQVHDQIATLLTDLRSTASEEVGGKSDGEHSRSRPDQPRSSHKSREPLRQSPRGR
jgi:hypothetical protein